MCLGTVGEHTWVNFVFINRHYQVRGKAERSDLTRWASFPKQGTVFRLTAHKMHIKHGTQLMRNPYVRFTKPQH